MEKESDRPELAVENISCAARHGIILIIEPFAK
jgi:hypothetical protein